MPVSTTTTPRVPDETTAPPAGQAPDRALFARRIVAAAAAIALVSILVLRTSEAAFTATTENEGNEFATVTIALDQADTRPLFGGSGAVAYALDLYPDATVSACVDVAFSTTGQELGAGDLTEVNVAIDGATGALADELTVTVAALDGPCASGAVAGSSSATLSAFGDWDSGWTPDGDEDARGYRFTVDVGDVQMGQELDGVTVTWSVSTDAS
jgi:hypothetical protein